MAATATAITDDTKVMNIEPVTARVRVRDVDGETQVWHAQFDFRDRTPGGDHRHTAIVQMGRDDGSCWMVGLPDCGWVHDEFPTVHDAIAATLKPATRRRLVARTALAREASDLRTRLAEIAATLAEAVS